LGIHFEHLKDVADLHRAVQYQEKAVSTTSDGHLSLSDHLNNLGVSFKRHFGHTGHITKAASIFSQGAQVFGPPSDCFTAALNWIKFINAAPHDTFSHHLKVYTYALQLLPKLAWLG
jgi:hypothetical protein